jgi:hypothetical protein
MPVSRVLLILMLKMIKFPSLSFISFSVWYWNVFRNKIATPLLLLDFLIDTHSKNETEPYWRSEWGNDIKFSSQSSNSRGVAILFRNTFQYHTDHHKVNLFLCFFIIFMHIIQRIHTIVKRHIPITTNYYYIVKMKLNHTGDQNGVTT